MTDISRRIMLKATGGLAASVAAPAVITGRAFAADTIEVGALHDSSGSHSIYGKEMDDAVKLAVEEINAAGGVLGRQINLSAFDTGSNMQNYAQFAQRLVTSQKASVVFGGVSSASRETSATSFWSKPNGVSRLSSMTWSKWNSTMPGMRSAFATSSSGRTSRLPSISVSAAMPPSPNIPEPRASRNNTVSAWSSR